MGTAWFRALIEKATDILYVVDGTNAVYVLNENASTARTQVTAGQKLIYGPLDRVRLTAGNTFNLNTWMGTNGPMALSVNGTKPGTPDPVANFTPANAYQPYTVPPTPTPSPSPTVTPTPTPSDSIVVR